MKALKRMIALLLAMSMLFAFVGCTGDPAADPQPSTEPTEPPTEPTEPEVPTEPTEPTEPPPPPPPPPPHLPQTGQLNWPIPVMAMMGCAMFVLGVFLYSGRKGTDDEA